MPIKPIQLISISKAVFSPIFVLCSISLSSGSRNNRIGSSPNVKKKPYKQSPTSLLRHTQSVTKEGQKGFATFIWRQHIFTIWYARAFCELGRKYDQNTTLQCNMGSYPISFRRVKTNAQNEYKISRDICTPEDRLDRFSRNAEATSWIEATKKMEYNLNYFANQPIRSKNKTNHDSLAHIFPRFASATRAWLEFWLVHWIVCVRCDWPEQ